MMSYLTKIMLLAMTYNDALDILDLEVDYNADTLKKAYRKAAFDHHPDRGGSEEQMQKVNQAYNILKEQSSQESSKVNWDAIYARYRKAGTIVIEQLKKDFKPEAFTEYFSKQTGKKFSVAYSYKPDQDIKSPSYAGITAVWTSEDKNTSFSLHASTDLHEVVWPKGSLTSKEDDIGYNMWIDTEIFHENRKVKFKRRNWDKTQLKSVLYDPEKTFPSAKISEMLKGKNKARVFARRDMYIGITKKLGGSTVDNWAYIPIGKDNKFQITMYRSVIMRKAEWSLSALKLKEKPHTKWDISARCYMPESEEILNILADLQVRLKEETNGDTIKETVEKYLKKEPHVVSSVLRSIQNKYCPVSAGDMLDLKPRLKEKKIEDKEKKKESIKPDFNKASLRVSSSSAYAGGYELTITVPVSAEYIKDTKNENKGEFISLLHSYIHERIGVWMGTPFVSGFKDRAKNGMLSVKAMWHFHDPYFAYSLGLNLAEWRSSAEVVKKNEIAARENVAEKAMKELNNFKSVATKKLQLRSKDKEEQNKIWKEEFRDEWVKLSDKWKERGISYYELSQVKDREKAVGFIKRITAKKEKLDDTVSAMLTDVSFQRSIPDLIEAARAGIKVGHMHNKEDMVKFNALSLTYFEALRRKDLDDAVKAAKALVKEGHGAAFGL